jgi:hypothetical protein
MVLCGTTSSKRLPALLKKATIIKTKTKTIAMILLIAIATIGAIGITIGTVTQSAQAIFGRGFGLMTTIKVMTTAAAMKTQAATPKVPNP